MKNLKIGKRLGAGFSVILIFLLIISLVTFNRMQEVNESVERLVNVSLKNQRNVAEWSKIIELNGLLIEMAYIAPDINSVKGIRDRMKMASQKAADLQEKIGSGLRSPESQAQFKNVIGLRGPYLLSRDELLAAKERGDELDASKIFSQKVRPLTADYLEAVANLAAAQQKSTSKFIFDVNAAYSAVRSSLIWLCSGGIIIGGLMAIYITRSIVIPIEAAVHVAHKVSAGDLTSKILSDRYDETGLLMKALAGMNSSLHGIVKQVRGGTDTIENAASEIALGNLDLSKRTEQQASALEETASSLEELTSTVRKNSDSAQRANRLAADAADVAKHGGVMVGEVVQTMQSINSASKKVADIISVIDAIAFQTNILALNAAVEAARAGEGGRGFAVVATEVRNLAHRSSAAAKEISELILDSVQQVDAGTILVDKAGGKMGEIVTAIEHVSAIMDEISLAGEEQRRGIEQVNQAVIEMDNVTQQNAALVEESAAAASTMQEQAMHLAKLVSVFRI